MRKPEKYPDDENGDVLRRMYESGDDLSKARDIDFTVVLPSEDAAQALSSHFIAASHKVRVENAGTIPEFPWDVVVVKRMVPTHAGITAFEEELEAVAAPLGGRNDGWGCFEQPEHVH